VDKHGKLKAAEGDSARRETEFEQWTLPGGENYYEIVLTVPRKKLPQDDDPLVQKLLDAGPSAKGVLTAEEIQTLDHRYQVDKDSFTGLRKRKGAETHLWNVFNSKIKGTLFSEGHHDVDNTVVHIRLKVRIDSKGRRILFIEEIQSDWHQAGRDRGYSREENAAIVAALQKKLQAAVLEVENRKDRLTRPWEALVGPNTGALKFDEQKIRKKLNKARQGPVAEGEFKKTQEWVGLAVRRILREAAEGGYDGVAFTTGGSVYGLMGGKLEGQRKFYDEILPSIVKKESKSKLSTTTIKIPKTGDFERLYEHEQEAILMGAQEVYEDKVFNFLELTPEVKARGMKAQKLFEVLIAASSVPAAAALMGEDEEEPKKAEQ
jgi:hypothetical protein